MKTEELLAKGSIDISDDITFKTHKEVMKLFGVERINERISIYKHPDDENVQIWFPIFYDEASNDWENRFGDSEQGEREAKVFEWKKNGNNIYLEKIANNPSEHTRILFAKDKKSGRVVYQFKGVYVFDPELAAKAKKAAYRRTAKSVELIRKS
jgi:hypothetical protein